MSDEKLKFTRIFAFFKAIFKFSTTKKLRYTIGIDTDLYFFHGGGGDQQLNAMANRGCRQQRVEKGLAEVIFLGIFHYLYYLILTKSLEKMFMRETKNMKN